MPRPSHSPAARSEYIFEPDPSAINSSRARTEQRHTAANTPPPRECYPVAVPRPGPRPYCLPLTCRTPGLGCPECAEDWEFSPYDRDGPRHVSHGSVKPEPVFHQHNQHSEADSPPPSQRGRPYYRPSSYDETDREREFDRHGRFGDYSPPPYDSANDDSWFDDDVHRSYGGYKPPFESQSLSSFFRAKLGSPGPDSRSQDRENRDTNLDHSGRSRSLGRGSMELPLGVFPDYTDFELRQEHERGGFGPPLISYSDYTDLERRNFHGRGSAGPFLGSYPDHADFERRKDYDPKRAGVRPTGPYLTRHRFEDDSEADALEDDLSEAFIHRPRLARPRGHHSDSDVGSFDTDTEEEYFKHIRDFDSVNDAIADRYSGRLRAPTAAEKTHRRYLVKLSKDFDREYLRAEEAQAELRLKRHDTHVAHTRSGKENDIFLEQVALQKRKLYSARINLATAGLDIGNRKPSPRGRRDAQESDSENITPQPQATRLQVRHQTTSHPTTINHSAPPREAHNNPSQPRRAPERSTRPQKSHSNSNTAQPKDQAPPSYDSVSPAQVTDSVQLDAANDTPRPPLATIATETTPPNENKASPRSYARNPATQKRMNRTLSQAALEGTNTITARPQQAVQTPLFDYVHTSPAGLGTNNHSESSGSGAATPMTSSDDDDDYLDDDSSSESAGDRLGKDFLSR